MVVAVDVGYGDLKAVAESGARCTWQSTAQERPDAAKRLGGVLGGSADGHLVSVGRQGVTTHYRVGGGGRRAWAATAAERAGYEVHVLTAVQLLGAEGQVDVVVGLPLALWFQPSQRQALADRLRGLSAQVTVDRRPAATVTIRSVRVLPQGAGAFQWALSRDPGLADRPTGLLDCGYRTTDYLLMRRADRGLAPDEAACGSVDAGVGVAYERVRQALGDESGVLVPEGAVEDALRHYRGRMFLCGQEVDVAPRVRDALRAVAGEIADELRRAWTDRLGTLGAVLLAGGGGEALAPHLRALHPLTGMVPDAAFSNALGFLSMLGVRVPALAAAGA